MLEIFNYTLIHPAASPPVQVVDSIGYDLFSVEDVIVPAARIDFDEQAVTDNNRHTCRIVKHNSVMVRTGLVISFDGPYGAFIWPKSGLGSKSSIVPLGFVIEEGNLLKMAGVIEGTFRGEWKVVISNLSQNDYEIKAGSKIAQVVFQRYESPVPCLVELDKHVKTIRGERGWGSGI